ncbi:MAG: hypothetical protein HY815_06045 [Candidatus Riflebacteria bacterium]|nr:hypothetical protein [Candidatus Riflebacteria bacterium]
MVLLLAGLAILGLAGIRAAQGAAGAKRPRRTPAVARPASPSPSPSRSPAAAASPGVAAPASLGPGRSPSPSGQPSASVSPSSLAKLCDGSLVARGRQLSVRLSQETTAVALVRKKVERLDDGEEKTKLLERFGVMADLQETQADLLGRITSEASRVTTDFPRVVKEAGPLQNALDAQRSRASRSLDELVATVKSDEEIQRLSEEVRLSEIEQEAQGAEISALKQRLTAAIRRTEQAGADVGRLADRAVELPEVTAAVTQKVRERLPGLEEELRARARAAEEIRRELREVRELAARGRVEWLNLRLEVAGRRQELAQLRTLTGKKILQVRRPRVAVSDRDVSKAAESSRHEKAEADKLRQQARKVAVEAEVERAEAQKVQERAQKRDQEIQKGAARGEEREIVELKKRLLAEELQLAEDRSGLAAERGRVADASTAAADAKSALAENQVTRTQALARAVAAFARGSSQTGPLVAERDALTLARRIAGRKIEELARLETALVESLQLQKRRRTVVRDRLERQRTSLAASTHKAVSSETLRVFQEQLTVCEAQVEALTRQLELNAQTGRTYKELLQFYRENLVTVEMYVPSGSGKVTVSSLREGVNALVALGSTAPARLASLPNDLKVWRSSEANRNWAAARLRLLLALVAAALLAAWLVRSALGSWASRQRPWVATCVAVFRRVWMPLACCPAVYSRSVRGWSGRCGTGSGSRC